MANTKSDDKVYTFRKPTSRRRLKRQVYHIIRYRPGYTYDQLKKNIDKFLYESKVK